MSNRIQVLTFKTGDGKILFTKEVAGDVMHKIVKQVEQRHQGIRSMELVEMASSKYYDLNVDQIAILEVGR